MGDKYVLDSFGRASNTYAKSALDIVKRHVRDNPEGAEALLDKMKGNLDQLATKAIHSGITNKYTSINTKDGHIEFRSPGGDWLDENFDKIENTLLRFTVAMSAALNPEMYRQEYLTKLYKLLSDGNKDVDTIKYFSDYVAGKIPKAALRSFVKQAQLQRNIKRGKTSGQSGSGTYELYNKQTGLAVPDTEFSARNEADQATRLQDYINHGQHGMNAQDASYAFGVRPVTEPSADQDNSTNPLRPTGPGPWEIYNRQTGNRTIDLVQGGQPITDRAQAQQLAMNTIAAGRHDLYGVRTRGESVPAQQTARPESPFAGSEEGPFGGTPDIEPNVAQNFSQDRTDGRTINFGNQFSGQWRVLDANGNELWRFRGVGNNQADANRIALRWLIDNGYGHGTEISVLPVMI